MQQPDTHHHTHHLSSGRTSMWKSSSCTHGASRVSNVQQPCSTWMDDIRGKLEVRLDNVVKLMMEDITMVMENSRNTTADGGKKTASPPPSKEYVDRATSPIISSSSQYDVSLGSSDVPDMPRIRNTTVALLFEASAAAASPTVDGPTPVGGGGGYDDGKEAVMRVDRVLRGWLSETLPLKEVVVESLLAAAAPNVHYADAMLNWMTRKDTLDVLLQLVNKGATVDIIELLLQRLVTPTTPSPPDTCSEDSDDADNRDMVHVLRRCLYHQHREESMAEGVADILKSQLIVAESLVGNNCYRSADYRGAAESYKAAIDVITQLPHHPPLHTDNLVKLRYNLARALYRLGEWTNAVVECDACLALDASYANARVQRAQCHTALLRFEEAAKDYQLLGWTSKANEVGRLATCDHYTVLRLPHYANDNDVKTAFRDLARLWHPDKNGHRTTDEIKRCHAWFHRIQESYRVLTDPIERMEYDLLLRRTTIGGSTTSSSSSAHTAAAANITPTPPSTPSQYFNTTNEENRGGSQGRRTRRREATIRQKDRVPLPRRSSSPHQQQQQSDDEAVGEFTFITAHTEAGPAAAAHHHTHSTASANTVRYHHYDGHTTLAEGSRGESAAKRDGYQQDEADADDAKPSSSSFTTRRDAGGIQAGFAGLKSRMSEVFSSRPSEWRRRGSLNKQGRPSTTRHSRSTSALISDGQDDDDDENMDVCGGQDHDFDDDDDATDGFCCNSDKNGNENIFRQWWDAAASSSPLTKARRRRRRTTTFVNKANDDDKGVWVSGNHPFPHLDQSTRRQTSVGPLRADTHN
ncbi:hypothetical protein FOZ63_031261 [Perkinsus olseni]|uniref:J domain-containing protein n=1 Tax=Perkinsus olseni TaxID=32597 RepID=A0A7J6RYI7_PEROL|nr:hypothetical protein FOZ63_031261 [Perkinsus olseni]